MSHTPQTTSSGLNLQRSGHGCGAVHPRPRASSGQSGSSVGQRCLSKQRVRVSSVHLSARKIPSHAGLVNAVWLGVRNAGSIQADLIVALNNLSARREQPGAGDKAASHGILLGIASLPELCGPVGDAWVHWPGHCSRPASWTRSLPASWMCRCLSNRLSGAV